MSTAFHDRNGVLVAQSGGRTIRVQMPESTARLVPHQIVVSEYGETLTLGEAIKRYELPIYLERTEL